MYPENSLCSSFCILSCLYGDFSPTSTEWSAPFSLGYLEGMRNGRQVVMVGKAWKWHKEKLKYIFHDYAEMKMHGLIKKLLQKGSAYGTSSLLSNGREGEILLTEARTKFMAKRKEQSRAVEILRTKAFCWSLKDMLLQLKVELRAVCVEEVSALKILLESRMCDEVVKAQHDYS